MRAAAVVVVAMLASSSAIAWAAQRPADPVGGAGHLLQPDGATSVDRITADGDESLLVSEYARQRGAAALVALPASAGNATIGAADDLGIELDRVSVWRSTSHRVVDGEVGPATTSLYLDAPDGVYLVGSWGGQLPSFYDPPVQTVPADAAVGDRWVGSGDALPGSILTYAAEAEVVAVEDDCVTVHLVLRREFEGELFDEVDGNDRWCPGLGSTGGTVTVRSVDDAGAVIVQTVEVETTDDDTIRHPSTSATPGARPALGSLADAVQRTVSPVYADPLLGDQAIGGTVAMAPVLTADERLLVPMDSGEDVIAYRQEDDRLVEQWRVHPGGELLTVAAVGDTLITSSTEREIVGYGADGVRRWSYRTDDLVLAPAVAAPRGRAVVVGLDGTVTALDLADGSVAWSAELVTDADRSAVTVDDVVVVTDRNGTVIGLDATDGAVLWDASDDPVDVLAAGPGSTVVAVDENGRVRSIDTTTGTTSWSSRVGGFGHTVATVGDLTIVGTGAETVAFDASGERVWTEDPVDRLLGDGAAVVSITDGEVETRAGDGSVVGAWSVPVEDGEVLYGTVTDGALWLVTSSAAFSVVGEVEP